MPQQQPEVASADFLGRSVSDQKRARQAKKSGRLHPRSLHPRAGDHRISVDKLNRIDSNRCAYSREHVRIAKSREGTFFGWGYFTRGGVVENKTPCSVVPDRLPELNPNHVLIEFPEIVKSCRRRRNEIAQELANISKWLEYQNPE